MAYSFNAVRNETTDRMLAVTDATLHLFMYLFVTSVDDVSLTDEESHLYNAYKRELAEHNVSDVNIRTEEIYHNKSLTHWYLISLTRVLSKLESFGDEIDHIQLSSMHELNTIEQMPVPVSQLRNLINDICWLLTVDGYYPSEEFKWFEDSVTDF